MNILYISQYFYPEMGAASARAYELSSYWVSKGHSVTVLTCLPNYPDGKFYEEYKKKIWNAYLREEIQGINVVRAVTYPTHLRNSLRRGFNYISFFISSSFAIPFLRNYDIVIATSPPLFVGITGLFCSHLHRIPIVFEVRDLWPEVMSAVGAGGEESITYKFFDKIASVLYNKSDIIVTLTDSFKETIASTRGISSEKIKVIENAVDTDFFKPCPVEPTVLSGLGLKNKFIISYTGTIGLTHGVEVVLTAAEELKKKIPELVFLFVGSGYDKERLMKIKEEKGLDNIIFMGRQPRNKIPILINASDISLVLSSKAPLLKKTIFAKVFEPMACGKPVIVGAKGETENLVVNKAKAGIGFEPENVHGLIDSVTKLYENPQLRKDLGRNGRDFVTKEFSRSKKAMDYLNILEEISAKNVRKTAFLQDKTD